MSKIYVIATLLLLAASIASCVHTEVRTTDGDIAGKRLTRDRN